MKQEIWQNQQPILTDDLIYAQSSKEDAIKERYLDSFSKGIISDSQLMGEPKPFDVTVDINNITITVGTGSAMSPTGERIAITDSSLVYNEGNTASTSPDGLGGFVSTPQSTGSKGVTLSNNLVANSTYTLWLGYLKTIDTSVTRLKYPGNDQILYVKATDGYELLGTLSNTNPDISRFINLGTITTDYNNPVHIQSVPLANRENSLVDPTRVSFTVPTSANRPASYISGETRNILDFVNSVGTGVVSNINPLGMSIADLTGGGTEPLNELYQKESLSNGIIGTTGTLDANIVQIVPDTLVVSQLVTGEAVYKDGKRITGITGNAIDTSYSIGGEVIVSFGGATGYYNIVLTDNGIIYKRTTVLATDIPLWKVYWTGPGTGQLCWPTVDNSTPTINNNLPDKVYGDNRLLGVVSSDTIQRTPLSDNIEINHNVTVSKNLSGLSSSLITNGQIVVPSWNKFTFTHNNLSSGSTSNAVLITNLPAGGVIHGVKIKASQAFTGGTLVPPNAYYVGVGVASNPTKYASNFDVSQVVGAGVFQLSNCFFSENHSATTPVYVTATAIGDLLSGALTGSVDIWLLLSVAI